MPRPLLYVAAISTRRSSRMSHSGRRSRHQTADSAFTRWDISIKTKRIVLSCHTRITNDSQGSVQGVIPSNCCQVAAQRPRTSLAVVEAPRTRLHGHCWHGGHGPRPEPNVDTWKGWKLCLMEIPITSIYFFNSIGCRVFDI